MLSPAAQSRMRLVAAHESEQASASNPLARATGYELMLAKLASDKKRLKSVQGIERKKEIKAEILPAYAPYVDGVLSGGKGAQDDVFMTIMVWRIDAGDNAGALNMAEYALKHKLILPDQFERTLGTLIAEEYADMAIKAHDLGKAIDVDTLLTVGDLTEPEDMPDEVRAKLSKAIGYGLLERSPTSALVHLRRALELHDKAGVKKDIERLEREIRKTVPDA